MLGAILAGLIAALVVALPTYLSVFFRDQFPSIDLSSAVFILGVGAVAMMLQKTVLYRESGDSHYDGLADLFIHIHSPFSPDSPLRWAVRGWISFLLTLFGGSAGAEGAAVEWIQSLQMRFRIRSSRWFEQRRRSDISAGLAAGISAAFGTPFAGMLLPLELGIGGRSISTAVSAISAFLFHRLLMSQLSIASLDLRGVLVGFHFSTWREWVGIAIIGGIGGVIGTLTIRFVRYTQEGLQNVFQTQAWMRILAGAVLLALVCFIFRSFQLTPWILLEQILWSKHSIGEAQLLFFAQLLSLALVLAGFGSVGIFWPLFTLGGIFGFCLNHWLLTDLIGSTAAAGLAGGVAIWGAVLRTPLAGAVLAFEMTQNLQILLPCLIAGFTARECRRLLRTEGLIDRSLMSRGVTLIDGRSAAVLNSITVREAMATDHEIVHEQEPVSELHSRLLKSRYPFLPVVNSQGFFTGLLTIDMVQEGWQAQEAVKSTTPLTKLLEAKDLLYRAGFKVPTVKVTDPLSVIAGVFNDIPCVPVLGDDRRVLGLLFVYNVRLAYDREIARRALPPGRSGDTT